VPLIVLGIMGGLIILGGSGLLFFGLLTLGPKPGHNPMGPKIRPLGSRIERLVARPRTLSSNPGGIPPAAGMTPFGAGGGEITLRSMSGPYGESLSNVEDNRVPGGGGTTSGEVGPATREPMRLPPAGGA
jgi:hypothetical protein